MKRRVIKVSDNNSLVKYLTNEGIAKNKVKTLVKLGYIYVNNKIINI